MLNSASAEQESPEDVVRVLCADDNTGMRAVLQELMLKESELLCVGCLTSADTLVEEARRLHAEVAVVDASMPGRDPLEAIHELTHTLPHCRAVLFSAWDYADMVDRAIHAGAAGAVSKAADPMEIITAIKEVAAGGTYYR